MMARKMKARDALWQDLQNRPGIDELFVGASTLADVIALLATVWVGTQAEEAHTEISLPGALHPGLLHCRNVLNSARDLSQAEHLLVSVARVVIEEDTDWPADSRVPREAIIELCESIRLQQRQHRRSGMNMMNPGKHPEA